MIESLKHWGPLIASGPAANLNDEIFEYLSPLNRTRFSSELKRLESVLAWKIPVGKLPPPRVPRKTKMTVKERERRDQGRKSRLVGRLFERLLHLLFEKGAAITALTNIRTTTSEIDLLLQVQPMGASCIPMLRNSTHLIGEAKCHAKAPSSQLTDEFVGFLQKHNARIGLLFVNCSSRSLDSNCRVSIALHWAKGFEIVPLGRKQLEEVRSGAPFLRVLRDQHTLAAVHTTKIAI